MLKRGSSLVPRAFLRMRILILFRRACFVFILPVLFLLYGLLSRSSRFTSFATKHFANEFDTFSFVRLRLAYRADLRSHLTDELLVGRLHRDDGVLTFQLFSRRFDF